MGERNKVEKLIPTKDQEGKGCLLTFLSFPQGDWCQLGGDLVAKYLLVFEGEKDVFEWEEIKENIVAHPREKI